MDPQWFVYILRNANGSRFYTGTTNDRAKRLKAHNAGRGAKATRPGRPWVEVYHEVFTTKSEALRREAAIKKLTRAQKERLVGTASSITQPPNVS